MNLDAIIEREDAATVGPWTSDPTDGAIVSTGTGDFGEVLETPTLLNDADRAFIVHAREDVPNLLDRVVDLTEALEVLHLRLGNVGPGPDDDADPFDASPSDAIAWDLGIMRQTIRDVLDGATDTAASPSGPTGDRT